MSNIQANDMVAATRHGKVFIFFVDDVEYEAEHSPLTGRELMDIAQVPHSVGLVQILEDGTQDSVQLDEVFELKPGQRFKKAPRFKRG